MLGSYASSLKQSLCELHGSPWTENPLEFFNKCLLPPVIALERHFIVSSRRPFKLIFIFGNRKKISLGSMSGEYGGCEITFILFLVRKS